jgi:hypothetical protein
MRTRSSHNLDDAGVRQAANPCTALGQARLAHLARARGTVSQKPVSVFTQAQMCEFKAASGTPIIIVGTWDASHLSFASEVSKLSGKVNGTAVRQVKLRGTAEATTIRGTFQNVHLPVLAASHDGFMSVVIVVTRVPEPLRSSGPPWWPSCTLPADSVSRPTPAARHDAERGRCWA